MPSQLISLVTIYTVYNNVQMQDKTLPFINGTILKLSMMGVLGLKESLRTIFKSLALKEKPLALFRSPCSWPCKSLHLLCFVTRRSFTAVSLFTY